METIKMNEKESLELISQMIQSTKKRIAIGSGNPFLFYGYFALILSVAIFELTVYDMRHGQSNQSWEMGWYLMFLPWAIQAYRARKNKPEVITYIDSTINKIWSVIGWLFVFTVFFMLISFTNESIYFRIILQLGLLYCGIGVAITGVIIKERMMMYLPLIAIALAIHMIVHFEPSNIMVDWFLYFGLAFIPMMIIPGHILNYKAKRKC